MAVAACHGCAEQQTQHAARLVVEFIGSHLAAFDGRDVGIGHFLSTKIYAHLRYDSSTPRTEGTRWHQWQLKEILSIGFAYKFQRG